MSAEGNLARSSALYAAFRLPPPGVTPEQKAENGRQRKYYASKPLPLKPWKQKRQCRRYPDLYPCGG